MYTLYFLFLVFLFFFRFKVCVCQRICYYLSLKFRRELRFFFCFVLSGNDSQNVVRIKKKTGNS
jgi:hypothetical protein